MSSGEGLDKLQTALTPEYAVSIEYDTSKKRDQLVITKGSKSVSFDGTIVVGNLNISFDGTTRTVTYRTALDLGDLAHLIERNLCNHDKTSLKQTSTDALKTMVIFDDDWLNTDKLKTFLHHKWFKGNYPEVNAQIDDNPDLVNIELHLRAQASEIARPGSGRSKFIIEQSRYNVGRLEVDFDTLKKFITVQRILELPHPVVGAYIAHVMAIHGNVEVEDVLDAKGNKRVYVYTKDDRGCNVYAFFDREQIVQASPPVAVARIMDLDWDANTVKVY